jgi:hypothetical protein
MQQSLTPPTEDEIRSAVSAAIAALCADDRHLLDANASERSMSHMLAVHLISRFPGYEIDCEYNRDGFDVKKLMLSDRSVTVDQLDAVTVFPDIIVHKRGRQDQNLLVLEMKKASSAVAHDHDMEKLSAFKSELKYRFAALVVIGLLKSGQLIQEVKWQ